MIHETEQAFLALMLDPGARRWARAAVPPEWVSDSFLSVAFAVACDWDRDRDEELTVPAWAKLVAERQEIPWNEAGEKLSAALFLSASPANVSAYAALIRSDWERRTLKELGAKVYHESKDPTADTDAIAARAMTASDVIRGRNSETVIGSDALLAASERTSSGMVPTGFPEIDRLMGMAPGDLVTVAGRTSMGKTAFAVDVARHALRDGVPVGFATLEMSPEAIWRRLRAVNVPLCGDSWFYFPRRSATVAAIESEARNWAKLGLLVIDHLQLIAPAHAGRSRYEAMTETVHECKRLARALEVPVMLLSQLNRSLTARQDRRPELSDLRDSGAIEEDSDSVILLHRQGYYDPSHNQTEAFALVAKNRHGATGAVSLVWRPDVASFASIAPEVLTDPWGHTL